MPWSEEKKALVEQAVGSSQYTSSDESDFSDDENGQPKLSGYLVKKLPWERSALTKVKKALDDAHIKSLNVRARVNMVARRLHPMPSAKPRPIDGLDWAMRSEEPATATSRTFSPPTPAISSTVPRLQQGIHFMASAFQHLQLHLTVSNAPQQEAHLAVSSLQQCYSI